MSLRNASSPGWCQRPLVSSSIRSAGSSGPRTCVGVLVPCPVSGRSTRLSLPPPGCGCRRGFGVVHRACDLIGSQTLCPSVPGMSCEDWTGHVIVCGRDGLALRITEELRLAGESVAVVDEVEELAAAG